MSLVTALKKSLIDSIDRATECVTPTLTPNQLDSAFPTLQFYSL